MRWTHNEGPFQLQANDEALSLYFETLFIKKGTWYVNLQSKFILTVKMIICFMTIYLICTKTYQCEESMARRHKDQVTCNILLYYYYTVQNLDSKAKRRSVSLGKRDSLGQCENLILISATEYHPCYLEAKLATDEDWSSAEDIAVLV